MDVTAGELLVNVKANTADFQEGMKNVSSSTDGFTNSLAKQRENLNTIGRAFGIFGAAAAGAIAASAHAAISFNTDLANLQTMVGNNSERMGEWRENIQGLSIDMGATTADLTDGAYQVVSAFGDTEDAFGILRTSAMAAKAGVATTTESLNLLSAVTKGYGDTSQKAVDKAADLAFQTVKLGQTTFPELAGAIGRVTPLAASLGVAQEELFAVMATGTGVTGGAAEVSTQLRGVLQSLMSPTAGMKELLADLGYESGEAMLEQNGLIGSLKIIQGVQKQGKVPLQEYISSIEGQTLALALTGAQTDTYNEKLGEMYDSTGAMTDAFDAQTEGVNSVGFQLGQLRSRFIVLIQNIGESVLPVISVVGEALSGLVSGIAEWVSGHTELIASFVRGFVDGIGMIVNGWVKMYSVVDDVLSWIADIIARAIQGYYGAFRWLMEKLGVELPDLNDYFDGFVEGGESAADKLESKWNVFYADFNEKLDESKDQYKRTEDEKVRIAEDANIETGTNKLMIEGQVNQAIERAASASEERKAQDVLEKEEKKRNDIEKEEEKARREKERLENESYKTIKEMYAEKHGEMITDAEYRHAAHLQALGEDWEGYLNDVIKAKTPTFFDKAFEGVATKFDTRIDQMADMWMDNVLHGSFKSSFDFMGEYLVTTLESSLMDVAANALQNFVNSITEGLSNAFKGGIESGTGFISDALSKVKDEITDIFTSSQSNVPGAEGAGGLGGLGVVGGIAGVGTAMAVGYGVVKLIDSMMPEAKTVEEQITSWKEKNAIVNDEDVLAYFSNYFKESVLSRHGSYKEGTLSHGLLARIIQGLSEDQYQSLLGEGGNVERWAKSLRQNKYNLASTLISPKFHFGGIVPGIINGQEVLARLLPGEEILTRDNPRHIANFGGGIHVTISGNTISSSLDMRELARSASQEIMKELRILQVLPV